MMSMGGDNSVQPGESGSPDFEFSPDTIPADAGGIKAARGGRIGYNTGGYAYGMNNIASQNAINGFYDTKSPNMSTSMEAGQSNGKPDIYALIGDAADTVEKQIPPTHVKSSGVHQIADQVIGSMGGATDMFMNLGQMGKKIFSAGPVDKETGEMQGNPVATGIGYGLFDNFTSQLKAGS